MLSLALAVTAGLTGISKDFAHYRRGQTTVCALATADPGDGTVRYDPDACVVVPRRKQAAYGFGMPPARATLPDGRRVEASVTLQPPSPPTTGEVSCLTTKGERCPTAEEIRLMEAITPREAELRVVARAAGGAETVLARTGGAAREVRAIYVSADGGKLIVVFTYEKMPRDLSREPALGVDVLGVDVGARLGAR